MRCTKYEATLSAAAASSPESPLDSAHRRGLLLINLGTPDSPNTKDVRRYLREFLSDPRVIDIPAFARWLLLNAVILPFRPAKSGAAYQKIWSENGSPLLHYGRALTEAVQAKLAGEYEVVLGMRYGNPSIASALDTLRGRGVTEITVFPLYPQYASSSTGSSLERVLTLLRQEWNVPALKIVPPFYDDAGFLNAFVQVGQETLQNFRADHVLFSFHGLPERQIRKSDLSGTHCLQDAKCCDVLTVANRYCYRAQSFQTARQLAAKLGLTEGDWSVSFQSRLGRTPWIKPYTDEVIPQLVQKGVKRLAVFCPAFVADCLETVEEIALRAAEQFTRVGGEALKLVPSLNAHPAWVSAAVHLVRSA